MESLDETAKNISSNMGFFKHVFNFNDDSKSEMMNITQYSVIALIPIIILNKLMQKYVPEADEEKGSGELLAEVIIQIVTMFIGILLINRIITYVPTYSGTKYPEFSVTYIILAVLVITLSLQTKLGEKVSILFDRVVDLWEGNSDDKKKGKKGSGKVKVTQPISQGGQGQGQGQGMDPSQMAMNQSMYGGGGMGQSGMGQGGTTSISSLPPIESSGQQQPDYNSMYQKNNTPMPGAATPGMDNNGGGGGGGMISAANEFLGSGFGSIF